MSHPTPTHPGPSAPPQPPTPPPRPPKAAGYTAAAALGVLLLLLTAAKCQQDGPGKPDTYTPSPKPEHVWVDPSGSPKPLPSGMKTGQQVGPS